MALSEHYRVAAFYAPRPSVLTTLFARISAWRARRATVKALSGLTARELQDLGLVPGDIDDIARGSRPATRV